MHSIILILTPGTWGGKAPKTNTLRNSCSVLLLSSLYHFSFDWKIISSPTFPQTERRFFSAVPQVEDEYGIFLSIFFYQQIAGKNLSTRVFLNEIFLQNFSLKQFLCSGGSRISQREEPTPTILPFFTKTAGKWKKGDPEGASSCAPIFANVVFSMFSAQVKPKNVSLWANICVEVPWWNSLDLTTKPLLNTHMKMYRPIIVLYRSCH